MKRQQGPMQFAPFTTATRDTISPLLPGMVIWNTDTLQIETWDGIQWTTSLTLRQLPPLFDAQVDATYKGSLSPIYRTYRGALDDNHRRVAIINMDSDTDITVLATDDATRAWGVDAETLICPVNFTVDKDDFSIEQVGFAAKKLKLNGNRQQAGGLLIKNTGEIEITAAGSLQTVFQTRFVDVTSTDALHLHNTTSTLLERLFFLSGSGTNSIKGFGTITQLEVNGGIFLAAVNSMITIDLSGAGFVRCKFSNLQLLTAAASRGLDIFGSENTVEDVAFIGSNGGPARQLQLNSAIGVDIQTTVQRCRFIATAGSHILFGCQSADGDGAG